MAGPDDVLAEMGGARDLLAQDDPDTVMQGLELLISLGDDEVLAEMFDGCRIDEGGRPQPGRGVRRWVHRHHHLKATLCALQHQGALGEVERLDMLKKTPELMRAWLPALPSLKHLRMPWSGHGGTLCALPPDIETLYLEVDGWAFRPPGAPPPEWHRLHHLEGLTSLHIESTQKVLVLRDLSFIEGLPALEHLTLERCGLSRGVLEVTHPTLASLTVLKAHRIPSHLRVHVAAGLRALTVADLSTDALTIEAPELRVLNVHRCISLRGLHLGGCPRLEILSRKALVQLERVTLAAACEATVEDEDIEVTRAP